MGLREGVMKKIWFVVLIAFFPACSDDDSSVVLLEEEPYVYNGVTYTGRGATNDSASPAVYHSSSWPDITVTTPPVRGFDADGFFILNGGTEGITNEQYVMIQVVKSGLTNTWFGRGKSFSKRIWLRFGSGSYTVRVMYMRVLGVVNLNYDGDITSWSYVTPPEYEFIVNNTRDEDGTFYYPSDPIQSDDPRIRDLALSITSGISGVSNKIRAIHDYVCLNLDYDMDSLESGKRKKQDAITSLLGGVAVCEGYTSLFAALLRASGIYAKCIAGYVNGDPALGHAWSEVDTGSDGWKYIDTTWDDPILSSPDPDYVRWDWFWLDALADHTELDERPERSVSGSVRNRIWRGYPAGVY